MGLIAKYKTAYNDAYRRTSEIYSKICTELTSVLIPFVLELKSKPTSGKGMVKPLSQAGDIGALVETIIDCMPDITDPYSDKTEKEREEISEKLNSANDQIISSIKEGRMPDGFTPHDIEYFLTVKEEQLPKYRDPVLPDGLKFPMSMFYRFGVRRAIKNHLKNL